MGFKHVKLEADGNGTISATQEAKAKEIASSSLGNIVKLRLEKEKTSLKQTNKKT